MYKLIDITTRVLYFAAATALSFLLVYGLLILSNKVGELAIHAMIEDSSASNTK